MQVVDTNSHSDRECRSGLQISWLLRSQSQLILICTVCKGRAYPFLIFSQLDNWMQVVDTITDIDKSADPNQIGFFRSQLIWLYSVCEGKAYPGSAGPGLRCMDSLIGEVVI